METINQAVERALQNGLPDSDVKAMHEKPQGTLPPVRQSSMRRFWDRMAAIYGYRWTSAYGESCEDDAGKLTIPGDTWHRGLADVGEKRIGTGLNACILATDPWPPTLPAFRSMCFSIPSFASAKHELRNGSGMRPPFCRQMWNFVDDYRFARADVDKADRMLRESYDLACEYVMSGMDLPPEPAALIAHEVHAPKETHSDPERTRAAAKLALDEIAKTLNITHETHA